ncbi:hypothetical protein K227x_64800 [Rubripirellula lacrimiformis]|uniref:Uncharacterized protein n=1 Tax=Rubripirellula lacrimiformis TaxID=1930273 RepID=A0A517NLN6_9BACT|nr:hypothetical protein [Rubripirellula lacrimiformis]QDT08050.1 hypothetical protein K227x_64800 [Rubripirellula lacrimiformis]
MQRPSISMTCLWVSAVWFITGSLTTPVAHAIESVPPTGLKTGDPIGAFRVLKVGGALDDGVEPGADLCYRCRYGSSPMVLVFARKTGPKAVELVRKLDAAIESNESSRLRGLVTFLGDNATETRSAADQFLDQSQAKLVPIVVAEDLQHGPIGYRIDDQDDVTIVVAQDSQVVTTFQFAAAEIDPSMVLRAVAKMLRQ